MRLCRIIILFNLIVLSAVLQSRELDFSGKSTFYFRQGEYGTLSLNLKNSETFTYSSEIKKPFVLKKIGNTGNIQVIFDARTMDHSELEPGKRYTESFQFVKTNIGKKEYLTVSAVYYPELQIIVEDTLKTDFTRLNFDPENTTAKIVIEALRPVSNISINDPDSLINFPKGALKLEKGRNEIEVVFNRDEDAKGEVVLNRKVTEGSISELYIIVRAEGFPTEDEVEAAPDPVQEQTDDSLVVSGSEDRSAPATTGINSGASKNDNGTGFGVWSIIVIIIMALIIIVLTALLLMGKSNDMCEKYRTFFDDVATLVRVDIKGTNIDKSIEEIMMILLEKFEFPQEDTAKPVEKKKVIKKPAGLKKPGTDTKKESETENIDLNFDDNEKSEDKDKEKKITKGFDFLDE